MKNINAALVLSMGYTEFDKAHKEETLRKGLELLGDEYKYSYEFDDFSFVVTKEEVEEVDHLWGASIKGDNLPIGLDYRTYQHPDNDLFNDEDDYVIHVDTWVEV